MTEPAPEILPEEIEQNLAAQEVVDSSAEKIKELEGEVAKLKDMYLRAAAETENVRNRAKRDLEDSNKYASTRFARDMVNIVENLVRASQSIPADMRSSNDVLKNVGEGIDMTMQELMGIFERNGIKRISPEGEKFDHNFHQAVAQVPDKNATPGTVLQVLQAGYVLHDRLLRPAMVTVATADGAA